jgi:hypothetical protein
MLKNNLPFDLCDVQLVFRNKFYPVANVSKGSTITVKLDNKEERAIANWNNIQDFTSPDYLQRFNPTSALRELMFLGKTNSNNMARNQDHRSLDWSWRLKEHEADESQIKEMILVARIATASASFEKLQSSSDPALATRLLLGKQATPQGTLNQVTFLRVIMPVAPKR